MISKLVGTILKKNTKTKVWWMKLGLALILSNIFFFVLFSGKETEASPLPQAAANHVEVQLIAQLSTPFVEGKKVLLVHRGSGASITGVLKAYQAEAGIHVVSVHENEANQIFQHEHWEILPYIKNLSFKRRHTQGATHEIRY